MCTVVQAGAGANRRSSSIISDIERSGGSSGSVCPDGFFAPCMACLSKCDPNLGPKTGAECEDQCRDKCTVPGAVMRPWEKE